VVVSPFALAKQEKTQWLRSGRRWTGISLVVVAGWHYAQPKWAKANSVLIRSVAVLPLDTLQHEHEQEAFAEGLTKEPRIGG